MGGERGDPLVEGSGADAAVATQLGERERSCGIGQRCNDALVERAWRRRHGGWLLDDFKSKGITAPHQLDPHRLRGRCGAMFDRQGQIIAVAAQIEIGVTPGVEFGGPAQRLTGADTACTLLGVMDDQDGDGMPALQLSQIRQQWRDLAAGSSMRCSRTKGSRMSRRGCNLATVSARLRRSASRSSRKEGAVMT